jgi:regulation of enolase protein 1 (concanavalin A-like superfamily)
VTAVNLRLIRDDGAVVYLNGTEVYRNNMPSGPINSSTFASTTIGGEDEDTWYSASINPALLVSGSNVIAVEIHQSVPDSSDIGFNFELKATISTDVTPPPSTNLPAPWSDADVGATGGAGSASLSGSTYTVTGAGADIWGKSDALHYAYQELDGDGSMIVRVASMEKRDLLAKAGIDFRTSLDPSATHAGLFVTPANGIKFIRRTSAGAASISTTSAISGPATPIWLKLSRSGGTISASRSSDGITWTLIGTQDLAIGQSIFVGLAVSSHQAGSPINAMFDNVTIG